MTGKTIGISLGTSNSVAAIIENGQTKIMENSEGDRMTPSTVAFTDMGELLVGLPAKRQAFTNPINTITGVKRLIGKRFEDESVQSDIKLFPYNVVKVDNGDAWIEVNGQNMAPPEIIARIFRKLKETAELNLGKEVTEAVVTVPAYFNASQRQAVKDAGHIAGFQATHFISDSVAAALAYGMDKVRSDQRLVVYDLGGGTFDISIINIDVVDGEHQFEVLSSSGDTHLGGEDFDMRLVDFLIKKFELDEDIDLRGDMLALQRLKEAAEKAKIELSTSQQTVVSLPYITANETGPKHLSIDVTRNDLESLVGDLIQKTFEACKIAIDDAGISASEISEVILVGGQTRMPKVQEEVSHFFGKLPRKDVNPEEVSAIGAAIKAGVLDGHIKNVTLLDINPISLGIETLGGVMTKLIDKNTTIPTHSTQTFSTAEDNQTAITCHVLQGENEKASENKSLGRFDLAGIPPAPRGVPQIEVSFDIDANGILNVSAKDKATGKAQSIIVRASGGLSKDEIHRMSLDNESKHVSTISHIEEISDVNTQRDIPKESDKIFISYRRELSADVTGRIYDRLSQHFEKKNIFKDVDSVPLGFDFRKFIDNEVSKCRIMLVVISKDWTSVKNTEGKRRIDDPKDFVRIEVESALKRNIPIIPILAGTVTIPSELELPDSLKDLTYRNAIAVRSDPDFHRDVDRLIRGIENIFEM